MQQTAARAAEEVDTVCLVVDASRTDEVDAPLLAPLDRLSGPVFCALNKVDRVRPKDRLLPIIDRWRGAHAFADILPISATDGTNCDRLLAVLTASLPEHPALFPADATSDQPETFYVAEIVRERIFHLTHEEVPYAVAVRVNELIERRRPERLDIRATIFVEQDSQKGILIGKGGAMLKRIGTESRRELERFFGIQVFLGLRVDVRRNWRKDPQALREFGFRLTS
jgi:GTP-binding protein Era